MTELWFGGLSTPKSESIAVVLNVSLVIPFICKCESLLSNHSATNQSRDHIQACVHTKNLHFRRRP